MHVHGTSHPTPSQFPTDPKSVHVAFHVLGKPSGAVCNLNCAYCFYLSKEKLYPGGHTRMSDELLETYLRQLFQAQGGPVVTIAWQGGEPTLLGLDFYERSVELARKIARPGVIVEHTMQTNGILLDDAWCAFLRDHRFLVGLSLDGPQAMHDTYRVDKGGGSTFRKVMRAVRLLQRHQVDFNILTTVNAANADHPLEVYRFLRDEVGARFIQIIPVVERADARGGTGLREGGQVSECSVTPEQWGSFLVSIFDEWVRRDVGHVFVQIFDASLAAWCGVPSALCILSENCGNAVVLEHNGDLYSCDHFVESNYLLGNITERHMFDLVASDRQRQFGRAKSGGLPAYCRDCEMSFACHGECPKNRFLETPDGDPGLNYLCVGYRAFFEHVDRPMRIMVDLLRHDRAPAEVMCVLAAEDARAGHP